MLRVLARHFPAGRAPGAASSTAEGERMAKKKSAGLRLAEQQVAKAEDTLKKARSENSYLRELHVREAQRVLAEAKKTRRAWGGT
jgi:hypothetical protein